MNSLTIVGDPHAKPDNLEKIRTLFTLVEHRGNTAVWMGDMLDTKEIVRSKCLNLWIELFSKSKLQHYILVGNHDLHSVESKEHSLYPLGLLKNVHVIDRPQTIHGTNVYAVPYIHDPKEFIKALKLQEGHQVLLMHQGITGFDYGNGYIAENEVPLEALSAFELVVSGHFHKFQKEGNLVYIGTPFSHSFGESDQEKFLGVLDLKTLKLKTIPMKFPQHKTFYLNCDSEKLSSGQHLEPGYSRVILTGSAEAVAAFDRTKYPHVKFIEQPDSEVLAKANVSETWSNEKKFTKWATEIKGLPEDTIKLGLEILKNV